MKKDEKVKVKVVRASSYMYDDYDSFSAIFPVSNDWEEVTMDGRNKIEDAVRYANHSNQKEGLFVLVEYSDVMKDEVFQKASDFQKVQEKRRLAEEKKKEEAKRKREEKAVERKRKQLEKLKKELGDD